jgi:uncharacterized protein
MQFDLEINPESYSIRSYSAEFIKVTMPRYRSSASETSDHGLQAPAADHESFSRTLVVTPHQLIRDWPPQSMDEIGPSHLETLVELEPEIVLLGSGPQLQWPDPELVQTLVDRGIGFEVMDTGAACRTYNILMSEHRRVVAALLMP